MKITFTRHGNSPAFERLQRLFFPLLATMPPAFTAVGSTSGFRLLRCAILNGFYQVFGHSV
jgi:hypothetical protein